MDLASWETPSYSVFCSSLRQHPHLQAQGIFLLHYLSLCTAKGYIP